VLSNGQHTTGRGRDGALSSLIGRNAPSPPHPPRFCFVWYLTDRGACVGLLCSGTQCRCRQGLPIGQAAQTATATKRILDTHSRLPITGCSGHIHAAPPYEFIRLTYNLGPSDVPDRPMLILPFTALRLSPSFTAVPLRHHAYCTPHTHRNLTCSGHQLDHQICTAYDEQAGGT
jgi:hypothetical protein